MQILHFRFYGTIMPLDQSAAVQKIGASGWEVRALSGHQSNNTWKWYRDRGSKTSELVVMSYELALHILAYGSRTYATREMHNEVIKLWLGHRSLLRVMDTIIMNSLWLSLKSVPHACYRKLSRSSAHTRFNSWCSTNSFTRIGSYR